MKGARGRGRSVVMLLGCCTSAFALNPALDISQYAHTSWKISDGFSKGTITSIAQTPDGYLWLGTELGLSRFDGINNVPWQTPTDQPLPSGNIRKLLTARDGTLWIGTNKGLASWKGGKLTQYAEFDGQVVGALFEDRDGAIWAGTLGIGAGKLCAIQKGVVECYGQDGRFGSGVFFLYEYRSDLWVGATTGLWRWRHNSGTLYAMPSRMGVIHSLIEGDNGALWIALGTGLHSGIYQLIDGKATPSPIQRRLQSTPYTLFRGSQGALWVGTSDRGLLHVHHGRTDFYTAADGLSGDGVQSLFEDKEGNIWVATTEGLDRFRDFAVTTISVKEGVSSPRVWSVLPAKDGSVWLGTSDGLSRWRDGRLTIYRKRSRTAQATSPHPSVREINDDGLPDNSLESLFEDDRGRIWVSTPRGIAWFEDGRFTAAASAPSRMVHNIVQGSGENLWINDQHNGLLRLAGGNLEEQIPLEKLGIRDLVSAVVADPVKGGLWLGLFQGGLAYFNDGQIRASFTTVDGLDKGRVNDFQLDRDGTLWVATEGGLSRLKDGHAVTLTKKNGLPCEAVHWAIEDDSHSFWLYLPCGLLRITRADLEAWAASPSQTPKFTLFDSSDGVKYFGTAGGYSPRVAKSADGKLWFVAYGDVSVIDPRHLPFNNLPPPVQIEQITADRKTYDLKAGLRLPPHTRDLQIDYTALSLVAAEKVRFRYKLEGRDDDWKDAGTRRQAFYEDLPPRKYHFRVIACNNSGVWNEAGAFLDFSVDPALYQTLWFQALCVAAFLAFLAGLHQLRVRHVARQFNMRMEARVAERTRIARDFHDTLLQSFQAALMQFSAATGMVRDRPAEAQKKLEIVIGQAREALTEGRDAVQGLRSSTVVTNDLVRAVTTLGEELAAGQAGQNCPEFRVQVEGTSRELAPLVRDEVHRIACEAIRNAFRHAQACRIDVQIEYAPRRLRLAVRDNGKGIDPQVLSEGGRAGHYGLPGMQERSKLVGGKLTLWSRTDLGTELDLTIPAGFAYLKSPGSRFSMFRGKRSE